MIEKIGPYRVYERLGVGGMGEVYKAYDDRLDRWVAIKRIRPDREGAEDTRERFKREARATARLNHPSIVHLYGIFQEGESDCIVMEYVEGQTLDSLLSKGPLDPLRVASLGHEIASGLAEAHANGILHRDLKAENIMITPRGRAKILDFGLAKPILRSELDPVLTGKGQLVGTSRAMSPEYVSGETVDHRSDLFSLGVLLYESLTGHSPFKAHNTLATLKQVMLHKQTPSKTLDPKIPSELSDLIDRLLEKNPEERPQSAHEVGLAFGRLTGQISSGAIDAPIGPLGSGGHTPVTATSSTATFSASDTVLDLRPRRRWVTVLIVIAALVAGAFVLGGLFQKSLPEGGDGPELPPEDRVLIVLADLANSTSDDALAPTLGQALRTVLEQSQFATVLARGQMRDTLTRMGRIADETIDRDTGLEIARREGAGRLVAGSIARVGSRYLLTVHVVDPTTDNNVFSDAKHAATVDDLLIVVEDLARNVRAHLGESIDEIEESAPLAKVATPEYEALKAYTKGLEKFEAFENGAAIDFFERALELDPGFAMAHARLGVIYTNDQQPDDALRHFDAALQNEDRLDDLQRYYVRAWKARWTASPEEVIAHWKLTAEIHQDFASHLNFGLALRIYRHDFAGAVEQLKHAVENSTGNENDVARFHLATCQIALGLADDAAVALEPLDPALYSSQSLPLHILQRSRDQAIASLADTPRDLKSGSQAQFFADWHQFDALEEWLIREAESSNTNLAMTARVNLVALYDHLGDEDRLLEALTAGHNAALPYLRPSGLIEDSSLPALASLGIYAARHGLLDRARDSLSIIDQVVNPSPDYVVWAKFRTILAAEIELAAGNGIGALERFDEALGIAQSFIAAEGRARALQSLGRDAEAAEAFKGLLTQRGLALMECEASCADQVGPVLAYWRAHRTGAELLDALGRSDEAGPLRSAWQDWVGEGDGGIDTGSTDGA